MERELTVRDTTEQNAAAVAELLSQIGYPNTETGVAKRLREIGQDADYRALVAVLGGQVVGVAGLHVIQFFEKDGNWCRLTALVVGITAVVVSAGGWSRPSRGRHATAAAHRSS